MHLAYVTHTCNTCHTHQHTSSQLTRRRGEEGQEDVEVERLEDEARAVWEEAHEKATIVRVIFL